MAKKQVIALPDQRKPSTSQSPSSWYNAKLGTSQFSETQRTHIVGSFTSTNGITQSENINTGNLGGNIYSSTGFQATVQTKTSTIFSTLHYIGTTSGISLNNPSMGQTFSTSAQANFTKRVCGFWCQVNGAPIGNDSAIDDGCGRCTSMRVSAVYMDSNRRLRVMEMCQGGLQLAGVSWNSTITNGSGWDNMSYSAGVANSQTIFNNGYLHVGWIINMTHEKKCGGGTKQKNCTGRIRYLTPLVSSAGDGSLYFGSPAKHQVIAPRMSYSSYSALPGDQYGIYTI